jgi:hypothetical protein
VSQFLPHYFVLFICQAVVDEILYPVQVLGIPSESAQDLTRWLATGVITQQEPRKPVQWFQRADAFGAEALAEISTQLRESLS